jgi:L-threonylcarbamoyladenylate synthase
MPPRKPRPAILTLDLDDRGGPADSGSEEALALATGILAGGGLVAIPTETVYGLAAAADDPAAVARIFAAKGRPASNPLIVHVPDAAAAKRLAADWPAEAERLANQFWPGPLTLVVRRSDAVPAIVTAGGPTVAIRCPAHPVARAVLERLGRPLAAPSANRSTQISPTCAADVAESLGDRVELILDGGVCERGIESTVVDLTRRAPLILRPGPIPRAALAAACGGTVDEAIGHLAERAGPAASPGLARRHYAPRTPLTVAADGRAAVAERIAAGLQVGWLAIGGRPDRPTVAVVPKMAGATAPAVVERLPADPAGCAAGLYAALRRLDRAGLDAIVVDAPPEGEEWNAVRDRLVRAAAAE